jgi:DNA-binding response OmpR family regulator
MADPESPAVAEPDAPSPPRTETASFPMNEELLCSCTVRIIVIDDDAATCQVIRSALSHKDFDIQTVSDPVQVEGLLKSSEHYHLVILDYVLPGLQSEQVLSWLRDSQPNAAVIVITGYPSLEGALNCLRAGTFDYLTKPFEIAQLRDTVFRCLQRHGLLRLSEEALWDILGGFLRERRKMVGFTLSETAKRSNVSLGYLSQIELGKNSASVETLYRICLALGMRMAELFAALPQS